MLRCSDARLTSCMMSDENTPCQKQRPIFWHRANHRIIIHRSNRAYCHSTIGSRHAMTSFRPNRMLGCSDARLTSCVMSDENTPCQKQRSIFWQGANHLIIYHLTNQATGHLTIGCGALHSRFDTSDAPLFGCSVARMDDVRMTAPHRTRPAKSSAHAFVNTLGIGLRLIRHFAG